MSGGDGSFPYPLLDHFPEPLRTYAHSVGEHYQCDRAMVALLGISAVSRVLHRQLVANPSRQWECHLPFWLLVRMRSGALKSTVMKRVMRPVTAIEKEYQDQVAQYRKLVHAFYAGKVPEEKDPYCVLNGHRYRPSLSRNESTPQGLVLDMAANHSAMDIVTAEGRDLIHIMLGQYNSGRVISAETLNEMYDGGTISIGRAGRYQPTVYDASGAIVLMTHEDTFDELLGNRSLRTGGTLARFFAYEPADVTPVPEEEAPEVEPAVSDAWEKAVRLLWERRPNRIGMLSSYNGSSEPYDYPHGALVRGTVYFTSRATKRIQDLDYDMRLGIHEGRLRENAALAMKVPSKAARIATALHALRHHEAESWRSFEVGEEDAQVGVDLASWEFERRAGQTSTQTEDENRKAVLRAINSATSWRLGSRVTREALRTTMRRRGPEEVFEVVVSLIEQGALAWGVTVNWPRGRAPRSAADRAWEVEVRRKPDDAE